MNAWYGNRAKTKGEIDKEYKEFSAAMSELVDEEDSKSSA